MPAGGGNIPQGSAGPCPAAHGDAARPRGGRDRPPYIAAESGQRPVNSSRLQRPTAGGGRESAVAGKGLSPCFAGCMVAGRMRRPGKILPRQGAVPLRRLRRHLPLQGRLLRGRHTERLPCKGSRMRRKAQTEGCIAGWRRKYPARSGRALPRVLREVRRPGEHSSPEGYLQGQVRHPSVACGDTSPCRGGFWGMRQPAVPGFAARVPYAVGRAFTPAGEACGGGGTAGLCKNAIPQSL